MKDDRIAALLEPALAPHALELEEVDVRPAGSRRVVRVVVDGDGPDGRGPLLDDIASATRAISAVLDESNAMGEAAYTLEVTSRGVSRPLTLPRHWRRNRGRLVTVTLHGAGEQADGEKGERFTGRILGSDDVDVTLDVEGTERTVDLARIENALVQVELNRPRDLEPTVDAADEDLDDDLDDDADDENDDADDEHDAPPTNRKI